MTNMSYCQFQNTVSDLRDCYDSDGMWDESTLSDEERRARRSLIILCHNIASEFEDYDKDYL